MADGGAVPRLQLKLIGVLTATAIQVVLLLLRVLTMVVLLVLWGVGPAAKCIVRMLLLLLWCPTRLLLQRLGIIVHHIQVCYQRTRGPRGHSTLLVTTSCCSPPSSTTTPSSSTRSPSLLLLRKVKAWGHWGFNRVGHAAVATTTLLLLLLCVL